MTEIVNVGSRLELFIDRLLVDRMDGVDFALHSPQLAPPARAPICGHYMTVLMDNGCYRGYFRQYDPAYTGEIEHWKSIMAEELSGRPERFSDGTRLHKLDGPTPKFMPGLKQPPLSEIYDL